jgi:hypothetical protein
VKGQAFSLGALKNWPHRLSGHWSGAAITSTNTWFHPVNPLRISSRYADFSAVRWHAMFLAAVKTRPMKPMYIIGRNDDA